MENSKPNYFKEQAEGIIKRLVEEEKCKNKLRMTDFLREFLKQHQSTLGPRTMDQNKQILFLQNYLKVSRDEAQTILLRAVSAVQCQGEDTWGDILRHLDIDPEAVKDWIAPTSHYEHLKAGIAFIEACGGLDIAKQVFSKLAKESE